MADASILADVSAAVLRLLRDNLSPELIPSPESVLLISPTDKNGDYHLGVYLYDIRELSEYKSSMPIDTARNVRRFPPKSLTLHYMLFLNAKAQIAASAEMEQRILGRAMQTLYDSISLDVSAVNPFLAEREGEYAVSLPNLSFEDKTKIWAALSAPYQVAVYFTVSPVLLSSTREKPFVRVASIRVETGQEPSHGEQPRRTGREG